MSQVETSAINTGRKDVVSSTMKSKLVNISENVSLVTIYKRLAAVFIVLCILATGVVTKLVVNLYDPDSHKNVTSDGHLNTSDPTPP